MNDAPPQSADPNASGEKNAPGGLSATPSGLSDLYRLLVESVRDYAIFALDPQGHVLSWNPGAERFKGYKAHEILGKHFSIFYPQEKIDERFPWKELEVAGREGRFEDEGWRVRKDGTQFWANVVITALRDATGQLVGFAKVTRDLTDRRRAEEALRVSEEHFRLLVEAVRDYGIIMLDPDGRIASWNEGAERVMGYTAAEIVGQPLATLYPAEDVAAGKPERELEIAARERRFEEEAWRLRKDGSRFWASVVVTPVENHEGALIGFAKVTRDLTERREAGERALAAARRIAAEEAARSAAEAQASELRTLADRLREQTEELERRNREAEEANRAKLDFLRAMSHELRTPLNAIGGYAELLALGVRGALNGAQTDDVERIRRSQRHLLGIINDILNFARLDAGQLTYDLVDVPVADMLDDVVPMIEPQASLKAIHFGLEPCPRTLRVHADRAKVEQILLNLLSNAVKFTLPDGNVSVGCEAHDGVVTIAVRDTGVGIPADKLEAIFEPFVQVGRSLARPTEGTGLGLAISRELARAMRGDLTVRSVEGRGSAFELTLPRA
ncbi:PAS sensor protein [Gemmatirosa kalamazoonensis]|uniref:histidine kinase n=1 Tax=Gemmatirosa kalamazoonensis TaxID=861299 RepID=W0RDD3_9BACT|nr:PAS domain-containing protein [Gemmatirosa kalamazoonensis]AHG88320.1 PAS sensor protein [Gemmatirosa kalamazoonensis]